MKTMFFCMYVYNNINNADKTLKNSKIKNSNYIRKKN